MNMADSAKITTIMVSVKNNRLFAAAQKCYLPREFILQNNIKIGTLVSCKYKDKDEKYICKVYALNNINPVNYCEISECVKLYNSEIESICNNNSPVGSCLLTELEILTSNWLTFDEIEVIVFIEITKFKQNIIKNSEIVVDVVRDLLQSYIISSHCLIDLTERENYGICSIFVTKTSNLRISQYGTISENATIIIKEMRFNSLKTASKKLGGLDRTRTEIESFLSQNLKYVESNGDFTNRPCCQLLLCGAPGIGKTSLLHNIISANKKLISYKIRGQNIYKPHPGETEKELRDIFSKIKNISDALSNKYLSIVLIEDIDVLCPKYVKGQDKAHVLRISYQIMQILDDISMNTKGIAIIASTSNIESLALEVRRPGRLEKEIFIKMPSIEERNEIVKVLMKDIFARTNYLEKFAQHVASRTIGYVGADLEILKENFSRQILKLSSTLQDCNYSAVIELCDVALRQTRPSVLRDSVNILTDINQHNLNSIGGMKNLKKVLETSIIGSLKHPHAFNRFGLTPLKGVLLYGPPGCAKTTIARCLAAETNMTFLSLSTAEIYSPYVGDSEKTICKLFNTARLTSPAIIFLDEIDTIAGNRLMDGLKNQDVQTRILSTLLTEMDGIGVHAQANVASQSNYILVIGATNRPELIDDALLRPGRFSKLIHVPAPDLESRLSILRIQAGKMPFNPNLDLEKLAKITINYSGADLCNLCNEVC